VANFPTYNTNSLINFGKLKQFRVLASANAASGQVKWEFLTGTAGSPNYSTNWRPYIGGLTLFSFDSIIFPHLSSATAYAAAQLNTASGGTSGFLPAVTSNRYYTFNIGDSLGNNYMAVWETTFNPTVLTAVTQNPLVVCDGGDSVSVNVTANQVINISENAYLRYSLTSNFNISSLVRINFNGTNGTAKIPIPSASNSIYFYVFTSKYSLATLAPSGIVNERYCDLSSLSINNNGNSNYSFTVITAALPVTSFNLTAYCVGLPTNFTNVSSISTGTISTYNWLFGDGSSINSTNLLFTKTYTAIGTYMVSLTATSNLGCQKTANQNITINSLPAANSINAN
jgi:PKD repeat protein